MNPSNGIQWTNKSVLQLAKGEDPVAAIVRKARELVLRAKDAGWQGPPFNPIAIADLLKVPVEASANVPDARTIAAPDGLRIEFNPTQARERVRFSIAHELAHILFPDVAEQVRNRGGSRHVADDWQLEILCNIAASEFVMPTGSLSIRERVPSIEELMIERRRFDVSAEAFLIRAVKTTQEPVAMFCASPKEEGIGNRQYRIDYLVTSASAPRLKVVGKSVPRSSIIYSCTAIGYTERAVERWLSPDELKIECVGIPGYPGSSFPRVAGLVRFADRRRDIDDIRFVHGDVLEPRDNGVRIICQLVNDLARRWGGGVARAAAKRFPHAQREFTDWIVQVPKTDRLGQVHFARVNETIFIVSLIAQEGYGPSETPRIRYSALEHCLETVADFAVAEGASVHMPRIGMGESGGVWEIVEELVRSSLVNQNIPITVYDLPPKRIQAELFD